MNSLLLFYISITILTATFGMYSLSTINKLDKIAVMAVLLNSAIPIVNVFLFIHYFKTTLVLMFLTRDGKKLEVFENEDGTYIARRKLDE